ncbi:MAG: PEP-CTERM sorting domain-containing protein [Planctomycetota bacterium]
MKTTVKYGLTLTTAAALLAGADAEAKITENDLTGNVQFDGWDELGGIVGYGFNDVGPDVNGPVAPPNPSTVWPAAIGSFEAGSLDASLNRTFGTHFSSSSSLYSFAGPSGFTIGDATALTDVKTIVLTIAATNGSSPSSAPVLDYNSGSQALVATVIPGGGFGSIPNPNSPTAPPVPVTATTYQWDVTGLGVTSFNLDWTAGSSVAIAALQLEQSDVFSTASGTVIPEPTSLALLGLGGLLVARRRRG